MSDPQPDTAPRRAWARGIVRFFRNLLITLAILALLAGGGAWYGWQWINGVIDQPGPHGAAKLVLIPRGTGLQEIGLRLSDARLIGDPRYFLAAHYLRGQGKPVRAGEFEVPAGASVAAILELLQSGPMVVRRLTVPEGLTTQAVLALIQQAEGLTGTVPRELPEGVLLPDTYHFTYGDTRGELAGRMRKAMDEALNQAWSQRSPDLPLSSPRDLLALAALVEKETGVEAERARVAGVFINRLRKGMKLQSDPTVIYSLVGGAGKLERSLTRGDLDRVHPYNTYAVTGLPPGPIANPGRAALQAAAQPARHDELYFVADGSGGHAFAKSLDEHNRNVARWRQIQRERGLRE